MSVVEITTFRLAGDRSAASFLALDKRVQSELVPNQPGFLRRTTARREGEWVVVTLWATDAAATAFAARCGDDPVWTAFEGSHEPGSRTVQRFDTLD
jgi:heme-degrading monooxygenase HmoA